MFSILLRGAVRTRTVAPRSVRCLASQVPPKPTTPPTPPLIATASLDFDPAERLEERTGAKSSKDSLSSIERRRRILGRVSLAILGIALGAQALYLGRDWEVDELTKKDLPTGRWARTKERFADIFDVCNFVWVFVRSGLMFLPSTSTSRLGRNCYPHPFQLPTKNHTRFWYRWMTF